MGEAQGRLRRGGRACAESWPVAGCCSLTSTPSSMSFVATCRWFSFAAQLWTAVAAWQRHSVVLLSGSISCEHHNGTRQVSSAAHSSGCHSFAAKAPRLLSVAGRSFRGMPMPAVTPSAQTKVRSSAVIRRHSTGSSTRATCTRGAHTGALDGGHSTGHQVDEMAALKKDNFWSSRATQVILKR